MATSKRVPVSGTLRDRILAAKDVATETVEVPEWGLSVIVRSLTGQARDELEARFTDDRGRMDRAKYPLFRAWFASQAIVDEEGARVFSDADIEALGQKSAKALQRIFDAASALSALNPGDLDGITEDLKDDPSDGTGSD